MSNVSHQIQAFITRLDYKLNFDNFQKINEFQIDIYHFQFKPYLTNERAKEFTEFIKTLDLCYAAKSAMIIWVWFYQHEVDFRLSYRYNPRIPFRYNMKYIFMPRTINRMMKSKDHYELMTCPLDQVV